MINSSHHILPSFELRWFYDFEQQVFQSVKDWLQRVSDSHLEPDPDREDYYLALKKYDLGIKLRPYAETRHIELKFLQSYQNLSAPIQGRTEEWVKWSIPLPNDFPVDVSDSPLWVPVKKSRYLIKLSLDQQSPEVCPAKAEGIKEGCNIELTLLSIQGDEFWTFGLEAFSDANGESKNLEEALNFLFQEAPHDLPDVLYKSDISCGYAEWLSRGLPGHLKGENKGNKVFKRIFGKNRVQGGSLKELTTNHLFGEIWSRPFLSLLERSLITSSILAATGRTEQLKTHLEGLKYQGFTHDQAEELLIHTAHYAGWPAGYSGLPLIKKIFESPE